MNLQMPVPVSATDDGTPRSLSPARFHPSPEHTVETAEWQTITNLNILTPSERVLHHNQGLLAIRIEQLFGALTTLIGRFGPVDGQGAATDPEAEKDADTAKVLNETTQFHSILVDALRAFFQLRGGVDEDASDHAFGFRHFLEWDHAETDEDDEVEPNADEDDEVESNADEDDEVEPSPTAQIIDHLRVRSRVSQKCGIL